MAIKYETPIEQLEFNNQNYISKINTLKESKKTYAKMAENCDEEIEKLNKSIIANKIAIGILKMRDKELEEQDAFMAQFDDTIST